MSTQIPRVAVNQVITASKLNQIIDTVNSMSNITGGEGINVTSTPGGIGLSLSRRREANAQGALLIRCKNVRDTPIKRYGAAVIVGSLYQPYDPELSSSGPALTIGYPVTSAEDGNRFVVAVEPIPSGAIGLCAVTGVVLTYIRRDVGGGAYAKLAYYPDFQDALSPADSGQAELLWFGDYGVGNPGIGLILLGGSSGEEPPDPKTSNEFDCPVVATLPAVPTAANKIKFVLWGSASTIEDGTGDDKVWWTQSELTRWYPLLYTSKDGTPGA